MAQVEQQDENIGRMWNHCKAQGMTQYDEFQSRMDELAEEMNLQDVDECIRDAARSHENFVDAMENLGTRSDPVEISDDGSTYSDMPELESDYDRPMPTPRRPRRSTHRPIGTSGRESNPTRTCRRPRHPRRPRRLRAPVLNAKEQPWLACPRRRYRRYRRQ